MPLTGHRTGPLTRGVKGKVVCLVRVADASLRPSRTPDGLDVNSDHNQGLCGSWLNASVAINGSRETLQ